jgi:CubicO group peptidase (beta-lactamase class C family)
LKHILTHTAGFEEDLRDLITTEPARNMPRGTWLATHMPARVRPPGVFTAYSNYATALAGYIVERVSGMSWEDYIERHILNPLKMSHSTGYQPLPERLTQDMSRGYSFANGRFEPKPFEFFTGAAPAGAISASATDMAMFMLAHLGKGAVGEARILGEATAVKMQSRAFEHDGRLPGVALGFYEQSSHGLRIIGHGGNTQWFHTDLALIQSERIGVFISYNTDTAHALSIGPFLRQFLDHYYPAPLAPVRLDKETQGQAARVAGEYQFNRRSYTTFQKATGLTGAVTIRAGRDGSLLMISSLGELRLLPVGPLLYREELGTDLVAFRANKSGSITHGFIGSVPVMAMERVRWYQSAKLHWIVLGLGTVVFAATLWSAITRVARRRFGQSRADDALPGRPLVVWLAVVNLGFLIALALFVPNIAALINGPGTGFKVALVLPVIGTVLAIAAAITAIKQWKDGAGLWPARIRYAAVVLVAALFAWSLNEWNLLSWKL